MDIVSQLSYVHQLNLRNLKRNSKGFNFSCPICGDSAKNRSKARGYLLVGNEDRITYYCQNCGISTTFKKLIEAVSTLIYDDFCRQERQELLHEGILPKKSNFRLYDVTNNIRLFNFSKYFVSVRENTEAVSYLQNRKISEENIDKFLWCNHPTMLFGNKIIFPFKKGSLNYGFQARSIDKKFFYIFSPNESFKVYNIFNVDTNKDVFISESIIDSLHKTNSIAALGTSISDNIKKMIPKRVYMLDNDKPAYTKLLKLADENERMFIWPSEIKAKDLNELAVNYNWTNQQIESMIINNIYKGLGAKTVVKMRLRRKW